MLSYRTDVSWWFASCIVAVLDDYDGCCGSLDVDGDGGGVGDLDTVMVVLL